MERKSRSLLLSLILFAQVLVVAVPQAPVAMASQADNPAVRYDRSEGSSLFGAETGVVVYGETDVPGISVELPGGFPFYGTRHYSMSVTSLGTICFGGIAPLDCSSKPINEESFRQTTMLTPAWTVWTTTTAGGLNIAGVERAPDLSWVRVRWASAVPDAGTAAFDAFLYRDGRIRFDYGPNSLDAATVFSGISKGKSLDSMIETQSSSELDFGPTVTFRPYLTDINYVWIDQPLPGDVWVNGVRATNLPGLSHAIVVGWVPVIARATNPADTITLRAGSERLGDPKMGTVRHEWHPATSTAMVTLTAETSATNEIAAIDVQVLGGVEELLQYNVDILTPLENDVFSHSWDDRLPVDVPVQWKVASRGCPAKVSFYVRPDGALTDSVLVKEVQIAASNAVMQDTFSLGDSSRMRLSAAITPDPTCLLSLSAVGEARAVGDVSPPFITDNNCIWVKVETPITESATWLTLPPTVEGITLRTECGHPSWEVSAEGMRILLPLDEFSGYPGGEISPSTVVSEPYQKDELLPPPQGDLATEFSTSASRFEITYTRNSLPIRQGETIELWALAAPQPASSESPTALVEVALDDDETPIMTGVALDAWTPITWTLLEDRTVNTIRISVSSPTNQPLRVVLDGFLTHRPAALTQQGELAESIVSNTYDAEHFALHYSLDMTPPTGTASFRSNGGWIPLMPGATPGGPAQAYATLLPVGVDAHSGVANLRIVGDDGQVKLVKYETQVPWTFTVPWNDSSGAGWVTAERSVNVTFIDAAGNVADNPVPASVRIDGTYPALGLLNAPASGWFGSKTPILQVAVSDRDSGMNSTGEFIVGSTSCPATVVDGVLTGSISVVGTGSYTVKARARDVAGNVAERAYTVKVDVTPPAGTVSGAPMWTRSREVFVSVSATDAHSGMADRRVGDDLSAAPWEPHVDGNVRVLLAEGDGRKTVYAEFRDKAGNTGTKSTSLILDTRAPIITPVSPPPNSEGNSVVGLEVKGTWTDDTSVTQDVSGVGKTGLQIYWTDGATGETTDVTNDPKLTATETGFTFRPVVLPGYTYLIQVAKSDRASNLGTAAWEFST